MITDDLKTKILAYNAQVPRYTSYPSAPHFGPMSEGDYTVWLCMLPPVQPVSIYVHIPFCTEMCWYCGCHTTATRKYAPVEDYVTLLLREMKQVASHMPQRLTASHIHFGGGSPTMLQPDDFRHIMAEIRKLFDVQADAEIAIEGDPRGMTHDKCEAYAQSGVNRVSLGVQDFAPHVQKAINRMQPYDIVAGAVDRLRRFDIQNINLDLMYGLPLQTLDDVADTAAKALSLAPQRIALFGYAHVPWMKKHMRLIRDTDLPDASARLKQFSHAEEILTAADMQPVGLDHFCASGDTMLAAVRQRCLVRNFQGYTTDSSPVLIGFGLSSIGRMPQGFVQNYAHITEYSASVLSGVLPVARGYALSADDRLRGDIISDLMCYLDVDIAAVAARHGADARIFDAAVASLEGMRADGLVEIQGMRIRVPLPARQMVRVAASRFDAHFKETPRRHVQAA